MHPLAVISVFHLCKSVLGLPFTSTTTVAPAVWQISDGQVQAAGPRPLTEESLHAGSGSSSVHEQNDSLGSSSVSTFTASDSMGSLTTQITTASDVVIKSLPGGQTLVGLSTTDSQGHFVSSTNTILNDVQSPQATEAESRTTGAVAPANSQQMSKELQATEPGLQTPLTTPVAHNTASALIQETLTVSDPFEAPSRPMSGHTLENIEGTIDAQRNGMGTAKIESSKRFLIHTQDQPNPSSPTSLQLQAQPTPTDPSQSGGPIHQMSVLSSGRPSSPSKGEIASSGTSSSQATDEAPAVSMAILDSQVASVHITQSLAIETGLKSFEVPIIGTSSNTPPPRPAEVTTSKPPLATLPAQGSLDVPVSTPLPPMTDPASIGSSLRVGDSITAQITDTQGRAVPAVMVLTTASGGSTSAKLVPVLPVPAAQTDSGPTSTMTTTLPNLSVDEAANSLWTTNTWITTTSPGGSEATVVPVLVGCPGCGGRGHGLVLWNLPKTPRVQFKFPGFPKVPRFHFPCIRVLGITIGSCSDPSKLPEIITDSPEPGDTESSDPQDENEDPDPDDEETDPDDEQSSTASQAREESTIEPSPTITSSAPSPSSSSSSSCPRRVTMSDFTICSLPFLKAAVHHDVQETRSLSPATGTDNPPAVTHEIISVADVSSIAPLRDLGSGSCSNQARTSMAAPMLLPISVPALTPPPPTPSPPLILPSPPLTTPSPPLTSLSPPPAEDPPVGEPPVDEPPVDDPPVDEPPPDDPQVDDPSGKDRAIWDMPADDVPASQGEVLPRPLPPGGFFRRARALTLGTLYW